MAKGLSSGLSRGLGSIFDEEDEDSLTSGAAAHASEHAFSALVISAPEASFAAPSWIDGWLASEGVDAREGIIKLDFDGLAKGGGGGGKPGGGGSGGGTTPPAPITVGDAGQYNIEIVFKGSGWTQAFVDTFVNSAKLITDFIMGDLPNVMWQGKIIDDVSINAEISYIDGVGNILGQAGPTAIRTSSYLPAAGTMQFDSADAQYYLNAGTFDDIVKHEMMHVLGFGTIWSYKNLVSGAGTATPVFTGAAANAAYAPPELIRVEEGGGSGTALSHWDEQTFTNEIMTGYINSSNQLSLMTVASFTDLGYTLDNLYVTGQGWPMAV